MVLPLAAARQTKIYTKRYSEEGVMEGDHSDKCIFAITHKLYTVSVGNWVALIAQTLILQIYRSRWAHCDDVFLHSKTNASTEMICAYKEFEKNIKYRFTYPHIHKKIFDL